MEFLDNTFIFKSLPIFYEKEKSGLKNNTVRIVSEEETEQILNAWYEDFGHINLKIKIENKTTGDSFIRVIKDISFFEIDNEIQLAIFTWKEV